MLNEISLFPANGAGPIVSVHMSYLLSDVLHVLNMLLSLKFSFAR